MYSYREREAREREREREIVRIYSDPPIHKNGGRQVTGRGALACSYREDVQEAVAPRASRYASLKLVMYGALSWDYTQLNQEAFAPRASRGSVYLIYWYKSTNTDAARASRCSVFT